MKYQVGREGLSFSVKVRLGGAPSVIQGIEGEFLKVRLAARPVDGKANEELIRLISRSLHLPKSKISIRTGVFSRQKVLLLEQFSEENFQRFLRRFDKG
jgi:uncharacterized protein (TIGR00251 family)